MDLRLHSIASEEGTSKRSLFVAWLAGEETARELLGPLVTSTDSWAASGGTRTKGSETPAIVTGQQSHWLGGPAFLLYKLATARALAGQLSEAGFPHRTLFWSHSDDADTGEVDHLHVVNPHWDVQRIGLGLAPDRRPLYCRTLPENARAVFDATFEACLESPHKAPLRERLLGSGLLADGISLAEHFERWLRAVAPPGNAGFEIVEPRQAREPVRSLLLEFLERSSACAGIWRELEHRCREAGFDPPFEPFDSACFFVLDEQQRRRAVRLDRDGETFRLEDASLSRTEMRRILENGSQTPLAGALLRVLLQSRWLPVSAYVGGPSELAYHSYALALFPLFDLARPALIPRMRATMVSASSLPQLERFGVSPLEPLSLDSLLESVPDEQGEDTFVTSRLLGLEGSITSTFAELSQHLAALDTSLARSLEHTGSQISAQIDKVRARIQKVQQNRAGTGARQARKLVHWLQPLGKPQERVLSGTQLLTRIGPDLPDALVRAASPFDPRPAAWVFEEA